MGSLCEIMPSSVESTRQAWKIKAVRSHGSWTNFPPSCRWRKFSICLTSGATGNATFPETWSSKKKSKAGSVFYRQLPFLIREKNSKSFRPANNKKWSKKIWKLQFWWDLPEEPWLGRFYSKVTWSLAISSQCFSLLEYRDKGKTKNIVQLNGLKIFGVLLNLEQTAINLRWAAKTGDNKFK